MTSQLFSPAATFEATRNEVLSGGDWLTNAGPRKGPEAFARYEVEVPKAGMFLWVKIPEAYSAMGSIKFSIEMMNRANVALAPGAGFGEEGDGYLRLALVENENRIRQALKQMRQSLKEIDREVEEGTFVLEPQSTL